MDPTYAVFCGIDVGKGEHHAVGLDPSGTRLFDKALPNDETKLRTVFDRLAEHGPVLVIVDQPNTIGALPVTVARACGHAVAYLPGLTMRRVADLYPGQAKTDARDAFIIADTARTMPHTLRRVDVGDEALAELGVLVGFDDDLAGEATRISNRIRGLLTGIHPALERVLGPRIAHPAVLEILSRCGGPVGIRKAGKRRLTTLATKHAPRMGTRLAEEILAALDAQSVTVPGSAAAEIVLPKLADSLKEVLQQRKSIAEDVERMLDDHPLSQVLMSMPGVGIRTAARVLLEVGDGSAFASAAHLAAYAGIAPVTHRSGSSIRGEHPARSGNRKLKRALFLSAFAALHDPTSRAYYDRKRAEGKKHNAALICLARRRCDVLYAMLKNKTFYRSPIAEAA
ncbi:MULTISPECIES: IS110 family transposase [Rhodococcus]|uniref:IS110 family transposase n=1 Tax=Rhodococcus TaxID=1827 RepID=UPI0007D90088|nr:MULTISPECIES: IS110 family transposase [Rhodococcus]APE07877.1 IS110 family transposase [Rhodococcus sp. 2G]APE08314.1 IS110 family transposase [Rhodococcus sp. 2G]APE08514.1 IS110 family transposase [Rhodococcus sp. 2G]APE08673.1 IS110 family transposase [Rhodococcus sp. 2G]APE09670.1 IS110 family transposase [Rhodococcus sp. 2G]